MEGRGVRVTMDWNVQCDLWCSLDVTDCPTHFINNSCSLTTVVMATKLRQKALNPLE